MSKSCLSSNNRTITQQNTVETNISSQKPVINILSPAKPIEQHIINAQNKEIKLHELRRSASTIPRIVYGQPQVPHQTIYHAQQAQPCSPQSMPYQQRMFERKPSGQIIRQEVQQPRQSASIVFQPLTEAQKSAQIYAQALGPIMRQSQLPLSPPVGRSSHRYSKKSNEDSSTDSKGDISRNIIYQQPRSMSRGITRIRPVPAGPPVTLAVL